LMTLIFGIGFKIALISIVAYAVLPVLRNTIVGINEVNPAMVEAAEGMGMGRWAVLFRIELPLAVPVIAAGVRIALVLVVAVATLATFVNAGGLGDILVTGIKLQRVSVLVVGTVLAVTLALLADWLGGVIEDLLTPRGV
jgi:osmoprotectant transport system permease protein